MRQHFAVDGLLAGASLPESLGWAFQEAVDDRGCYLFENCSVGLSSCDQKQRRLVAAVAT